APVIQIMFVLRIWDWVTVLLELLDAERVSCESAAQAAISHMYIAPMHRKNLVRIEDLSWDDVRLFLALSRSRTVGQAARTLGIAASTAPRRLAALEEVLGATLFTRGRDGIEATKSAEDLLIAAEEVERGVARFANAVESLERDISGSVRITSPSDVAEVVI